MAGTSLLALIDDIATILDDVAILTKVSAKKAAGVLGDDLALNAEQVTGVLADRELPVVWAVAKGSVINKAILVPAALAISALIHWAITPLLMLGGAYLCFEGAEKVWEAVSGKKHSLAEDAAELNSEEHERSMVSGAVRTDFILSAEIMAIALAEVATEPFVTRALILAVVAVAITIGVYGVVGLIVKMDDIGLHLAKRRDKGSQALGRGLIHLMPRLMSALSVIGIAAMIWVGGGIIVHGLETFGLSGIAHSIHDLAVAGAHRLPALEGAVEWLIGAAGSGLVGLLIGGAIVAIHHLVAKKH